MSKRVLIIAAHPDDEILGCGGTAARLAREGNDVFTAILGEGVTSRDDSRQREKNEAPLQELQAHIRVANEIIGAREVFTFDLPDNRFDQVDLLDVVKVVEGLKKQVRPDIIFTHSRYDLNIDHRITYDAVLTATRPMRGEGVKEIYAFEVLSSSEWNFPLSFSPDVFYNITETLKAKEQAMEAYAGELRSYPHPRSLKGIRLQAETWGMRTGLLFAEAFETVRVLR